MSPKLTIMLVSAADNIASLGPLHRALTEQGHTVQGRALHARVMQERRDSGSILLGEEDQLFEQFSLQVGMADLFLLVQPDDYDTAFMAGMAHVAGVPVAIIGDTQDIECCFMVKGCVSFWCNSIECLLELLEEWPNLGEE